MPRSSHGAALFFHEPRGFQQQQQQQVRKNQQPKKKKSSNQKSAHKQPLCKARSKSKGLRKAHGHDVADDLDSLWSPFPDHTPVNKVRISHAERTLERDLEIAIARSYQDLVVEPPARDPIPPLFEDSLEESKDPEVEEEGFEAEEDEEGFEAEEGGLVESSDVCDGEESEGSAWSWESCSEEEDDEEEYEFVDGSEIKRGDEGWSLISVF